MGENPESGPVVQSIEPQPQPEPTLPRELYVPKSRRVKTPTVLQMEAIECGAAALSIVMSHYGFIMPLEQLRIECGVSRDGSKASNVLKAARKFGFDGKGYRREPEDLEDVKLPAILFWNFNHFVVLEGFKGRNKVFLNDPASGPRTVDWTEFDESFQKKGSPPRLIPALRNRLRGSEWEAFYVFLAGLLMVVPGLVIPIFSKTFIDQYLIRGMTSWVNPILFAMGITAIIQGWLTWLQSKMLLNLQSKIALSNAGKFFWHVLRLPSEFFAQRYAGDVSSRVAIDDKIATMLSGQLATTLIDCITIVAYAALMFYYDVFLTWICIVAAAVNIIAVKLVSRIRIDGNRRLQKEEGKLSGVALSGLMGIESLKASGRESDFFAKWADIKLSTLPFHKASLLQPDHSTTFLFY